MDNKEKALKCHEEWNGKLETIAKSKVNSREDLAIAYTPGVAEPCKVIAEDKEAAYKYTWKANTVAVVSVSYTHLYASCSMLLNFFAWSAAIQASIISWISPLRILSSL